jgi:hypothetical protein
MNVRYHENLATGLPHIYDHGVSEEEVEWILRNATEDTKSRGDSRQALGQTNAGRYLRVIYVPDDDGFGVFVVTAFPIAGKDLKAYRRRRRKR